MEFIDLQAQRLSVSNLISEAIEGVLAHGGYIFGPEVKKLEEELQAYTQAEDAITCSNGTDALRLLLLAYNIGPGDAVFVPTFTFASTAEVIAQANATPVFVDICPHTFNMDIASLEEAYAKLDKNLKPKGIIAVDLFGLPADYSKLNDFAESHQLWLIADAAQSFGGSINGKRVGTLAASTTTSFFPSKPLACYGDGGAIFTNDKELGELIRSLRNHGCGKHRYDHIHIGLNSRLDTIQAAILLEKLKIFPAELKRRQEIANRYANALKEVVQIPIPAKDVHHAWGLYTIACHPQQREDLINTLQAKGIPSNVYYRKPLHLQPAYQHFPRAGAQLKNAELACYKVLSLPMHPYLLDDQVDFICEQVINALS
ncbi:MAG: DegT/DnrJ/EryC1/StrS aminotransferase family protein [Proteobacteria bacterium]|nr:DegT/DnrJ/EryC1/StrS aminotransferase family protein [Pseudomonadota bacterium]